MSDAVPPDAPPAELKKSEQGIILISYPKIVFLWPTWLVSIVASAMMYYVNDLASTTSITLGWTFLIVLSLNLMVLSFDFPRATSLLLFAVVVAGVLGFMLIAVYMPTLIPGVKGFIAKFHPAANATFYLIFALTIGVIYVGVYIAANFDYWEVRPNELLHHHGIMSDLERFSSPNLRIDKEINDVFEYILAGSGRLILHPRNEPRAIVLDNVFFINSKETAITKMLGALQVQVRSE